MLLYIHNSLSSKSVCSLNDLNIEDSVWCLVSPNNFDKILVGVVYRSPISSPDNNSKIITVINNLQHYQPHSHLLLMGDFNLPNIDWVNNTVSGGDSTFASQLFDATQDVLLVQHSLEPTQHRHGQTSSTLDLVFTSDPDMIQDLSQSPPIGCSDHACLHWSFLCREEPLEATFTKNFIYPKGDYSSMIKFLSEVDWDNLLSNSSIETNWLCFKNLLTTATVHSKNTNEISEIETTLVE